MSRICPFTGCGRRIPPELFACGPHWYSLNKDQQRRIYACYDAWGTGEIDGAELRRLQQAVLDETTIGGTA